MPVPDALRSDSSVSSKGTTASAPGGIGAPVMIRTAVPTPTASCGSSPAATDPTTRSTTGEEPVAPPRLSTWTAKPVHGRVVQRRNVERPHDVLGQYLALGLQDRRVLGRQDVKEPENALPGLLDAQHRLVAMPVDMLSHG